MRRHSLHGLDSDSIWRDGPVAPNPPRFRTNSLSYVSWATPGLASFKEWVAPCFTPVPGKSAPFASASPDVLPYHDALLRQSLSSTSIQRAIDEVIAAVRPTRLSLDHREKVVTFVQIVLNATLGVKVVPHGSYALHTFLPDSNVNLSSFFTRNHDKSWFQRVIRALASDGVESFDPIARGSQPPYTPYVSVGVRSALFTTAPDGTRSIRVTVNGVSVEIGCNQGRSVAVSAFLEDADRRIGRNHLLKRTLILTKLFLANEARVARLLPSGAVIATVLQAFAISDDIRHPLQGMIRALDAFLADCWRSNVFTILGSLPLRDPGNLHITMASLAQGSKSLINLALLARHSEDFRIAPDMKKDDDGNLISFQPAALNVMDPLDTSVNLTARITLTEAAEIRESIQHALSDLKLQLRLWADSTALTNDADTFSWVCQHLLRRTCDRYNTLIAARKFAEKGADADDDILQANLDFLTEQVHHAGKFDLPKIAESDLIHLMEQILEQNGGTVTVGKMGSLMHEATNNHSLPAMIKSRFGGLKKLLKRHENIFQVAADHPHNPHVSLRPLGVRRASHRATSVPDVAAQQPISPMSPSPKRSMSLLSPSPKRSVLLSPTTTFMFSKSKSGSFTLSGDRKSSSADLSFDSIAFSSKDGKHAHSIEALNPLTETL